MNKKLFGIVFAVTLVSSFVCGAAGIDKNTAKMQAMDKITGRVSVIYVPVGGAVSFGSLSIGVRACKTRPEEETPDNFAFADVADKTLQGEDVNIFRGWMISSSPATNAVEHPIYDVWLLKCLDKKVDENLLLTAEQFDEREKFRMVRNTEKPRQTLVPAGGESARQMEEMNEENHQPSSLQPTIEFSYDEAEDAPESNAVNSEGENISEPAAGMIDSEN